jgi:bacillithiol biosynthesis cysteine-adding enzyme BshC
MIQNHFNFISEEPSEIMGFNRFDLDYWKHPELFKQLISGIPQLESIPDRIQLRRHFSFRTELHEILIQQYKGYPADEKIFSQIEKLLSPNTYTVICAHQPCLFGGPMFWAYKILSTIRLADLLNKTYPEKHFIPVYFSGNEDHDFPEINSLNIFQKKISWNEESGICCGRMPVENLKEVVIELEGLFQRNPNALHFFSKCHEWIHQSANYADFYRHFVHELFGSRGLIYFNPDDASAKKLFKPVIEKELREGFISNNCQSANEIIQQLGYPLQVNPRALNLFYHHESGRKRLIKTDQGFALHDSHISWSFEEIFTELDKNPQAFSPNVLLRPMYQEYVFPNLAMIGGGGEIAYWLQLKACFEYIGIPYPILIRRISTFYFDHSLMQKILKTTFQPADFLHPYQELENKYIRQMDQKDSFADNMDGMQELTEKLKNDIANFEQSMRSSIESEIQKIKKSLEHISSKRNKIQKQKHEQELSQILKIKNSLFPVSSIQERYYSFLPAYFKYGAEYFNKIENHFNPGQFQLDLFMELS